MSNRQSRLAISVSRPNSGWLTLVLLLAVLVPSVCLLWFMNQAVRNERLAVHQQLIEAYRANLGLIQGRVEENLQRTMMDIGDWQKTLSPPSLFAKMIRARLADSAVCYDTNNHLLYPGNPSASTHQPANPAWVFAQRQETKDPAAAAALFAELAAQSTNAAAAAQALQSQSRCLLEAGKTNLALAILTGPLLGERYRLATDVNGRLIAPNAELMALELTGSAAGTQSQTLIKLLQSQVADYETLPMPSAQRSFLMRRLMRLGTNADAGPMLNAEEMAARWLDSRQPPASEPGLHAAGPRLWQWSVAQGRIVLLFSDATLRQRLRSATAPNPPLDVDINFIAPGEANAGLTILPAGLLLPGWQIALQPKNPRQSDTAADEQIASYTWIGALTLLAVGIMAVLGVSLIRRQAALTQLRNDLVANVTHELKTPLASTRLLVDTLLNSPTIDEKIAREYLQLIAAENTRLSRLIDNFLTFSRMERNKFAFDFAPVLPDHLVQSAAAALRERFHTPGCVFDVQVPANLPPVLADADAFVTALINLLDNAWKYTRDEKHISFAAGTRNGGVFFSVKDNGIGLSPRDAKRIFQRFYQVDRRLSRSTGGCGLGLSIVHYIVTAHRGVVEVDSAPGRGSTFTITLPTDLSHEK